MPSLNSMRESLRRLEAKIHARRPRAQQVYVVPAERLGDEEYIDRLLEGAHDVEAVFLLPDNGRGDGPTRPATAR